MLPVKKRNIEFQKTSKSLFMLKEVLSKPVLSGIWLFLLLLSTTLASAQTPNAVVVDRDTSVCESGRIDFKVKFTGSAPFGIAYRLLNLDTDEYVDLRRLHQSDAINIDELDENNVWTISYTIDYNAKIEILKVYDQTIPQEDNSTVGDPAWYYNAGVDITDEALNVKIDSRTNPDAGEDIGATCGYVVTLDAAPEDAAHTHYWSKTDDGSFADVFDPKTTFEANTRGVFTLYFVEENGACKDSASVDVDLLGSPKAVLKGSATICTTDGTNDQIALNVTYQDSFSPYSYTVSDGTTSYDRNDITTPTDELTVPATGDQIFTITSFSDTRSGKQCFASDIDLTGEAVVDDVKPAAYAGEDQIVCGKMVTVLDAKLENTGNTGVWSANNVVFGDPALPNTEATVTAHGIYTMTWTETEPVLGCTNSNSVNINYAELPNLKYSKDTAICEGGKATLVMNPSGNSPWTLTYTVDGSSTDIVLNSSVETKEFTPAQTTKVTFDSIVGSYGCVTYLKSNYIITVDEVPVANAGTYDPVCSNQIELNAVPSITNTSGYWQGNGTFADQNAPSTLFTADDYGEQTLTWTEFNIKNPACISYDNAVIRFDQKPAKPYAGEDKILYSETSTTLEARPTDVGTGTWSASEPNITFDDINDPHARVDNLKMGTQILKWTVANGVCEEQSDDVKIEVRGLTNPNGFSPNGDGVNDFFIIMGAEQTPNNEFQVFNRRGKLVYSEKNYKNDWDGKGLDGSPLDDGTYYYIFTGDNIDTIKDFLIIKRSKTE